MIKLILVDLDGVLIKIKDLHYRALNKALGEDYAISLKDHHGRYDGLPTKVKLGMLTKDKGLPVEQYEEIWRNKQKYTMEMFATEIQIVIVIYQFMAGHKLKSICRVYHVNYQAPKGTWTKKINN